MSKKIVLTGGGTAGHITPNIALLPRLLQLGYEISYIGSYNGMEKKLIEDYDIPYYGISTGKFRRYFDLKNFTDPFRVLKGYGEARKILKEICPDIVFSKGGFVTVPVVRAASSLKIPCVIHESDMTPGLANKLCIPVCTKVCCNFPETLRSLPTEKAVLTGSPIREELSRGNKLAALELCHFTANKPVLMVIGGSLGAASINQAVREALPKLLNDFQVVHLCGQEKIDNLRQKKCDLHCKEICKSSAASGADCSGSIIKYIVDAAVQIMSDWQNLKIRIDKGCKTKRIFNCRHHDHLKYCHSIADNKEYDKLCNCRVFFFKSPPEAFLCRVFHFYLLAIA